MPFSAPRHPIQQAAESRLTGTEGILSWGTPHTLAALLDHANQSLFTEHTLRAVRKQSIFSNLAHHCNFKFLSFFFFPQLQNYSVHLFCFLGINSSTLLQIFTRANTLFLFLKIKVFL